MGNANVREDGAEPSGDDEDGQQGQNNEGLDIDSHSEQLDSSEMMGQTPPDSPRAARSPLMFTPQVPMVPLHRPDDMHSPNSAWPYNNPEYEDTPCENGIPYVITWCYGGREVAVEGSWDNWKSRKPMQRTGKDFNIMKVLPSGVYHYRFIVDGQRRYVPDLPWAYDDKGVAHNILDLQFRILCLRMSKALLALSLLYLPIQATIIYFQALKIMPRSHQGHLPTFT
ncbi:SNF1-related protein kinase regulatory subunit beta-2 isoform X2 [Amborella trichopoda]|uniref:SNF1-related protein kinase regulatory subunit beta-2 isoform X2 n=1 Tax=Amborella trichopoda TaxID=13333 RepID=UPI0009C1426E|nr:SNF1-related protein kinase regulatory subunit beta-2 isoform X2 [Amborella trichopoda]|eukprot:XP_020530454.1 SNF1-related protein kinase regulatory subunit beta-2 isoform X2 [Amborella trichopoda]